MSKEGERKIDGFWKASFDLKKQKYTSVSLSCMAEISMHPPNQHLTLRPAGGARNTQKDFSALALNKEQIVPISLLLLSPLTNIITASL